MGRCRYCKKEAIILIHPIIPDKGHMFFRDYLWRPTNWVGFEEEIK